jgi:hypothetical protein
MIELLSGIKTATFDSNQLRSIAYELVGGELTSRKISDREVVNKICDAHKIGRLNKQDIAVLAEAVCISMDLSFDPSRDLLLQGQNNSGLSEIFWRKIVSRLKNEPWVFICNYAENEASAVHNDVFGITYGFHENVTTWRGLVASGPGTFIIFYNTSNAPHSKMSYSSFARIKSIEEAKDLDGEGRRHWKAKLSDFHKLSPVPKSKLEIDGRNQQHGIQAVTFDTFRQIIELGGGGQYLIDDEISREEIPSPDISIDLEGVLGHGPLLSDVLPNPQIVTPREIDNVMSEKDFLTDRAISSSRKSSKNLDKQTETQAVNIALAYLSNQGWELLHDNQLDGVGYDFEFTKNGESLLIEIKGIRGTKLEFNMTAREFFVCSTKQNFRLIAVTSVLSEANYRIHVLCPSDIFQMRRRVTQFRFSPFNQIELAN